MRDSHPEIKARFARETAGHEMTILHDDGLYRHLKFANPAGGFYRFDLITWPHNMVVRGDGFTFAFSIYPTDDWFDVVRRTAHVGQINPGYWEEKVSAGREATRDYSMDLLKKEIKDTVRQWISGDLDSRIAALAGVEHAYKLPEDVYKAHAEALKDESKAFARTLRAAVHAHFYGEDAEFNVEYQQEAYRALDAFSFGAQWRATCPCGDSKAGEYRHDVALWHGRHFKTPACMPEPGRAQVSIDYDEGHRFYDFHEWQLTDFSWQYLFACHAAAWGVAQYVAARTAVAA